MSQQHINPNLNLRRRLWWALGACWAAMAFGATAQQSGYTYDQAGNTATVASNGAVPPVIEAQPQGGLFQSNGAVCFSVVANGAGMSYQWLSNGVAIPGATADTLLLANLPANASGSFGVVVRNTSGAVTSAVAALALDSRGVGMPDWWQIRYFGNLNQPPDADYDGDGVSNVDEYREGTNPTNAASYDPRLYITVAGAGTVALSPMQPYYSMEQIVTLTAVPSSGSAFLGWSGDMAGLANPATLTMDNHKSLQALFSVSTNLCVPPPAGIVGWWSAQGNAFDVVGGNDGTLIGDVTYTAGEVGEAFDFEGANGYVNVPNSTALGFTNEITIEAWIELGDLNTTYFIATKQPSGAAGNNLSGNFEFRISPSGYMELLHQTDTAGDFSTYTAASGIGAGVWHHVAATLVSGGNVDFYLDGAPAGTSPQEGTFGITNSQPLLIGTRADFYSYFNGLIDELSIYDRALSSNEINAVYLAGSTGKCHYVRPEILVQPQDQFAVYGSNVVFTVSADGGQPLNYQWQIGGVNLADGGSVSGSATANLLLSTINTSDAGNYTVIVSNAYGSVTSVGANLAVLAGSPALITFDDLTNADLAVPVGYNSLNWTNLYVLDVAADNEPGGYAAGMISASNVVYNSYGTNSAISSDVPFDLLSAYLTAAWRDNLQVELQGYDNALLVYDNTYSLSASAPTLIVFNYLGVTSVRFISSGGTPHPGYSESGTQFAMDNASVFFPLSPPVITLQPTSQVALTNGSATFGIAASGSLPLYYSWSRNGVQVPGATSSIYTNNDAQLSDSGSVFTCQVTNAYGSVTSSSAVLTVLVGMPTLITFDDLTGSSLAVPVGYNNLTWGNLDYLNAVAFGAPGYTAGMISASNVVYNGSGSNAVISSSVAFDLLSAYLTAAWRDNLQVELQGYNGAALIYDHIYTLSATSPTLIQFNYLGVTSVEFSSSGGTAHPGYSESGTQFAMDNVGVFFPPSPPVITLQPTSETVPTNQSIIFNVAASGSLPLNFSWSRNGEAIADATDSTYTTTNLQVSDSGSQFMCTVTNAYGSVTSSPAVLTVVRGSPTLITFDDLSGSVLDVPTGYGNLNWYNFGYLNGVTAGLSGYNAAVISVSNVVYNGGGSNAVISSSTPFDLFSAYLTAAWRDNLQVEVQGYNGTSLIYDNTYILSATAPMLIPFNYLGVTSVQFSSSGGTAHSAGYSESGTQFAMDNLSVFFPPSVAPLTLPEQVNVVIDELTSLVVTNTANEANLSALPLSYALLAAPLGAGIDVNGVITWVPSQAQSPSTNAFTTAVTDAAIPPNSASNTFTVIVREVNVAPVLPVIGTLSVDELALLSVTNAAAESNIHSTLGYSLVNPPAGMGIDSSGVITWLPQQTQSPSTNLVTTIVTNSNPYDLVNPHLSASNAFTVIVNEVNVPPVLPVIPDQTVLELTLLSVTSAASEPNIHATLSYLLLGPPVGMAVSPDGIITWMPQPTQSPSTNSILEVATSTDAYDAISPNLSVTNSFVVRVLARQQLAVNMVNGHPQLAWNCSPGTSFQVQYRTDLDTGAWLDLGLPIAAAGSTCQYEDDLSSSATTRYYQVVLLP